MNLEKIGGRKFVLCMFISVSSILLLLFNYIQGEVWKDVILTIAGIYAAGNVSQKYALRQNQSSTDNETKEAGNG